MTTQSVVITGGTRGIGAGMARAFLGRGHRVCITGRSEESLARGLEALDPDGALRAAGRLIGAVCEVAALDTVQRVWDVSVSAFGEVDVWINNAGVANTMRDFTEIEPEEYHRVVDTNLVGVMHGSRVALRGMRAQGHGQLYNFEGFGSDGRRTPGLSVYGATKRAVTYFTDALIAEYADSPVCVGHMSPGIVITDLTMREAEHMDPERWAQTRSVYNILADRVEVVTPWLVDAVLADVGRHGSRLAWLTPGKAAWRFFKAYVLRQRRALIPA